MLTTALKVFVVIKFCFNAVLAQSIIKEMDGT